MLNPHLRRAEHVAGWMKRDTNAADVLRFTVLERFDNRPGAKSVRDEPAPRFCAEVRRRSRSKVVTVGVRNHRAVHRLPGIDVKAAGRAVQTRSS